jgi:hypothetical protein
MADEMVRRRRRLTEQINARRQAGAIPSAILTDFAWGGCALRNEILHAASVGANRVDRDMDRIAGGFVHADTSLNFNSHLE